LSIIVAIISAGFRRWPRQTRKESIKKISRVDMSATACCNAYALCVLNIVLEISRYDIRNSKYIIRDTTCEIRNTRTFP
jgi:hypothetical protein